ncbi:MAG: sugar ABC transporter substrate-binding protein [Bifidobacteriaceae bacterium]|jgi:multiple sugar transport system substrate-binding protein|nr:sugar ABC transporter substrate-binding protein [Bifidobacteriaceae bacterium]
MNFFKKITAIGTALSLSLVLVACGSGDQPSPDGSGSDTPPAENVEINYFSFSANPDYETQLNDMVAAFEAENPGIKVKLELAPYDSYFTKLQTLLAGGTPPDVYEMNYENFVSYAAKDVLLDLSELVASDSIDLSKVNETAFKAYQYQGKQYGMTEAFSNVVTFYNKDLFDKAGIEYPTAEWTWKDEVEAAKKITDAANGVYGTYSPVTMNEFFKVLAQNGGSIYDADGKLTINAAKNVEALQYMVDLVLTDKVTPTPAEMSGQESGDLFLNGKLGMVHTGIWMFGSFKDAPFQWDIQVEAGNTNKATHFFANGLVVDKNTANAEAAYKFAKFMSVGAAAAQIRVDNSWELPISTDQTILDAYLSQTPPSNRQAVFDSLNYLVLPPVTDNWAKLSSDADAEFQKVLLGEETPQEALDILQAKYE